MPGTEWNCPGVASSSLRSSLLQPPPGGADEHTHCPPWLPPSSRLWSKSFLQPTRRRPLPPSPVPSSLWSRLLQHRGICTVASSPPAFSNTTRASVETEMCPLDLCGGVQGAVAEGKFDPSLSQSPTISSRAGSVVPAVTEVMGPYFLGIPRSRTAFLTQSQASSDTRDVELCRIVGCNVCPGMESRTFAHARP